MSRWIQHSDNQCGNRWWRIYPGYIRRFRGGYQQNQGGGTRTASNWTCNRIWAWLQFAIIWADYNWAELSWTEFPVVLSWVKRYSRNWVDTDNVLKRPDHAFGFGLKDLMPYGRIDESVFSYDVQYVTGWIMGLRGRVYARGTLWRLVNMISRRLTELQEQSVNAAHTSAMMHRVDTNGWSQMNRDQMDRRQRWIAARDGSRETDDSQSTCPSWGYWCYMKLYPSRDQLLWFQSTKLQSSADMQIYHVPAVCLHSVRYWALLRALFRDTKSCTYIPGSQCRIWTRIKSRGTATMLIPHSP